MQTRLAIYLAGCCTEHFNDSLCNLIADLAGLLHGFVSLQAKKGPDKVCGIECNRRFLIVLSKFSISIQELLAETNRSISMSGDFFNEVC